MRNLDRVQVSRALVAFLDRLRELCGEGKLIQMAPKVGGGVGAQPAYAVCA